MNTKFSGIGAVVLALFLLACQQKDSKEQYGGIVQISTTELLPDDHFNKALTAFANEAYKESSNEIELAIESMDTILAKAEESRKASIENSIKELVELKAKVAVDKVDGISELNYFFARAGNSLAGLHMNVSKTEYFNLDGDKAGAELEKALRAIENIYKYNSKEMTEEARKLMDELNKNVSRLKKGEKIPSEVMEKLFEELNDNITALGNELEVNYATFKSKRKIVIHDKPS